MDNNKFIYKAYEVTEDNEKIYFKYFFEIENISEFITKYEIFKKDFKWKHLKSNVFRNLIFNLGIVEAISYYKATCSKEFLIKCGSLNEEQKKWFRKLFYNGLGEFRYINKILCNEEEFVKFVCENNETFELEDFSNLTYDEKVIIPIGRGKGFKCYFRIIKGEVQKYNSFFN